MKILFAGQVPKDPLFPEANEDVFGSAIEAGKFALSDGATESFDSKTWAQIVVRKFLESSDISKAWINSIVDSYVEDSQQASLSWAKQAAFDRGSFATLLGLAETEEGRGVEVSAIGDSVAFLLEAEELVDAFPYKRSIEFSQRPMLLSTRSDLNSALDLENFVEFQKICWFNTGSEKTTILCMTDALAQWALMMHENNHPVWSALSAIRDVQTLEALVLVERGTRAMRVDDTTLVCINMNKRPGDELPHA